MYLAEIQVTAMKLTQVVREKPVGHGHAAMHNFLKGQERDGVADSWGQTPAQFVDEYGRVLISLRRHNVVPHIGHLVAPSANQRQEQIAHDLVEAVGAVPGPPLVIKQADFLGDLFLVVLPTGLVAAEFVGVLGFDGSKAGAPLTVSEEDGRVECIPPWAAGEPPRPAVPRWRWAIPGASPPRPRRQWGACASGGGGGRRTG